MRPGSHGTEAIELTDSGSLVLCYHRHGGGGGEGQSCGNYSMLSLKKHQILRHIFNSQPMR